MNEAARTRRNLRALDGALLIAELAVKHWDGGLTNVADRDVRRARAFYRRLAIAEQIRDADGQIVTKAGKA